MDRYRDADLTPPPDDHAVGRGEGRALGGPLRLHDGGLPGVCAWADDPGVVHELRRAGPPGAGAEDDPLAPDRRWRHVLAPLGSTPRPCERQEAGRREIDHPVASADRELPEARGEGDLHDRTRRDGRPWGDRPRQRQRGIAGHGRRAHRLLPARRDADPPAQRPGRQRGPLDRSQGKRERRAGTEVDDAAIEWSAEGCVPQRTCWRARSVAELW
jgi:hypothetical protein